MRKIDVKKITNENFQEYGEFYDMIEPKGNHIGDFYQDHVLSSNGSTMPMAFSSYIVRYTETMLVTGAEYHDEACEIMMPVDGDIIFYVAPPSIEPVPEKTEAFYVPRGTLVKIHAGVWHQKSFAADKDEVHVLIALPQRTYKKDCVLLEYKKKDYIEIVREQNKCQKQESIIHS